MVHSSVTLTFLFALLYIFSSVFTVQKPSYVVLYVILNLVLTFKSQYVDHEMLMIMTCVSGGPTKSVLPIMFFNKNQNDSIRVRNEGLANLIYLKICLKVFIFYFVCAFMCTRTHTKTHVCVCLFACLPLSIDGGCWQWQR